MRDVVNNLLGIPLGSLRTKLANNPDYARSVATAYGAAGLNVLIQIVLVPLYLHHLGKYQFGVLMILLALSNYLGFGITWASSGAQRIMGELAARRDDDRLSRFFSLTKLLFVGYSVLIGGVTLALALGAGWFDSVAATAEGFPVVQVTLLGLAYFVIVHEFSVDRMSLVAIGQQASANTLTIVSQAVFAVTAFPVLQLGWGIPGIIIALIAGVLVSRCLSFVLLRRHGIRWKRFGNEGRRWLARLLGPMGRGYALYGMLLVTLLQVDTLLVGWLGGAAMAAEFVLVWKIADVVIQTLWRIPESLQPYLVQMDARGEMARVERLYKQGQVWLTATGAVCGGFFALLGPYLVELWVGADQAPDSRLAYVLAGGAIFWSVSARLPAIYGFSLVRLAALNRAVGIELVARVAMLLGLFPFVGYLAPLIAVNVAHVSGVAILYRRIVRSLERNSNLSFQK